PTGSRLAMRVRSASGVFALGIGLTVVKHAVTGAASNLRMLWSDWTSCASAAGGIGVFSGWNTLIASTATDIAITGMAKTYPQSGITGRNIVQLGVGDAGFEDIIAEFFVLNGIWGGGRFNYPMPCARRIGAGQRVALRFATEYTSGSVATSFTLSYQEVLTSPDFDNWSDDVVQRAYLNTGASSRSFPVVCGSPAWANGSWVEIDPSVPADRVLTAYMTANPAQVEYELDFGVGAAGSEVAFTSLRMASGANDSGGAVMHDVFPVPSVFETGTRFAVRARGSTASATVEVVPHYTAEPATSTSSRNLLTGDAHTVDGSDNLIAGSGNAVTGRYAEAHGQAMTVNASLAVGFGLDGSPHTLIDDTTLSAIAAPAAQTYAVVIDDTGLLASAAIGAGTSGQIGPPGPAGEDADSWPIPGPPGPSGSAGAQGPAGPAGIGVPGVDGDDGLDGWPGAMGPAGPAGATGAPGAAGRPGPPGLDGEDGDSAFTQGINTPLVVTSSQPGLAPVLPGDSSRFLNGNGVYSTPAGSGATAVPIVVTANTTVTTNNGWVIPESLEIEAGVILEIEGGARIEITGNVDAPTVVRLIST